MVSKSKSKPDQNGINESFSKEDVPLWKSILSLEPAIVVHMAAAVMALLVVQDFLLVRACSVNLGYSDEICEALQSKKSEGFASEEKEVQKLMGKVIMFRTAIENAFPIVLVFLIGAWSDKYGRKLPFLFVILAFLLQNILLILCVYFKNASGTWTIAFVSSFIASLSGNQACFMMAAFSYVADNTSVENRTMRTGIAHTCIFLGLTLGLAGGAMVSKSGIGFANSFFIAMVLEAFAFFWCLIMMKNQGQPGATKGKTNAQIILELFDFKHVKDAGSSVFKKREGNTRLKLWLLLLAHTFTFMPLMGEIGVTYLFCRLKFNWDGGAYGSFITYKTVLGFLSNFISMGLLTKVLKLSDPANGIVAGLSNIATALLFASAISPTMMYIAPLASILSGAALVVPRATISKLIPSSELGKVNSFMGSMESIIKFVASTLYTTVYTTFLDVLPGSFYLISVVLTIPVILIHIWFLQDAKTTSKKSD